MTEEGSLVMPLLFKGLVDSGELIIAQEEVDADANSIVLNMDDMEEEEDDSTLLAPHLRPPSGTDAASPVKSDLYDGCRQAASKLGIS